MKLRKYQEDAVQSIFEFFERSNGNPLVSMNVGTGKSVTIAGLCKRVAEYDPHAKIMVAVSRKELIQQNYDKIKAIAPELDVGLFSSGLNKRQRNCTITYCGVQSVARRAFEFGKIEILIIDEAHEVNLSGTGAWHKLINDLKVANSHLRVVGFTGTPFRTIEGDIHTGEGAIFDEVVYETDLIDMINKGFLSPITNQKTNTLLSTDGVHKRGGDFIESELQKAVDVDELTKACVKEIVESGMERKKWIIFASGIEHSLHIRDEVRSHGITCESVSGKTPRAERDKIITDYKAGLIRCVVNVSILNTGFDAPSIDLVGFMRPTRSPIIWSQSLGRGLRIAEGKKNCLLRDFTDNSSYFPPLDKLRGKDKRTSGNGTAPQKMCERCMEIVPASIMVCPNCSAVFPGKAGPDLNRKAATDALLSNQIKPEVLQVSSVSYYKHTKEGKPDTLRVDYRCGLQVVSEWVCIAHPIESYPYKKAMQWWMKRSSSAVLGISIDDVLPSCQNLKKPTAIWVRPNGKFKEIVNYEF